MFAWRLPSRLNDKESTCQCRRCKRHRFHPWVGKIPWRRKQQPTSVFLPGKSHGQMSLMGCSPWGHKRLGHNLATKPQEHVCLPLTYPVNWSESSWMVSYSLTASCIQSDCIRPKSSSVPTILSIWKNNVHYLIQNMAMGPKWFHLDS